MGLNFAGIKFRGFRGFGVIREIKSPLNFLTWLSAKLEPREIFFKLVLCKIRTNFANLSIRICNLDTDMKEILPYD